ncbi:hypothetical protein TSOC_009447 [Tetrabaena socialis]|uniref:Uncharacterized protein n=1 Tax=Tetrabaena socialis TaxID=47790 RepID=A0A2J7ZVU3_9CHLO|nr:hypothetical protein TSOC_009447 [Tetrabaena socialis]|eukprot:PNH04390.1 hypothetical protein TSOC_009447 [Tetrabaena socialis]
MAGRNGEARAARRRRKRGSCVRSVACFFRSSANLGPLDRRYVFHCLGPGGAWHGNVAPCMVLRVMCGGVAADGADDHHVIDAQAAREVARVGDDLLRVQRLQQAALQIRHGCSDPSNQMLALSLSAGPAATFAKGGPSWRSAIPVDERAITY